MKRREFIDAAALGLMAAGLGIQTSRAQRFKSDFRQSFTAKTGDIRAIYLGLGNNMWCDWPSKFMGETIETASKSIKLKPDLELRCQDDLWQEITNYMAGKGVNMLVVDLGEGLYLPSHPELAIKGTWSIDKMRREIERLNGMGIEVIPKLNFSTSHNGWMGDYRHMVSSKPYYAMCEDVISDVIEIFGHPRFFHIGMDEERAEFQKAKYEYICCRTNEFWWQDFLRLVKTIESHDCRAWMWSDYCWKHEDFFERCPKTVVQQNWYYDEQLEGFYPNTSSIVNDYVKLDKAGFDQVPCGTNWAAYQRRLRKMGADDVMAKLVVCCEKIISKEHLIGYMLATWEPVVSEAREKLLRGIDLFEGALTHRTINN